MALVNNQESEPIAANLYGLASPKKNPVSDLLNSSQLANPSRLTGISSSGAGYSAPPDSILGNSASGGQFPSRTNTPNTLSIGQPKQDYAFDIYNDPAFKLLRDSLSASGISDASRLRGAIQSALIGFGSVPGLSPDVLQNSGLDTGETQALAANNPFSVLKRLQQNYEDQQMNAKNQLAARGGLDSGETGYQLGRLGQQQAQTEYDARSSLLGGISGLNDQYAAGRQAAAEKLAQGALSAETNAAAQNNGAGGGTTITATWDPSTGLWRDPNGNLYDQSGNPATPSSGGAPPSNIGSASYTAPAGPTQYTPGDIVRGLQYA